MSDGPILEESYAIAQLVPQPPFQKGGATSFALASGMQGTITPMTAPILCSDGMRTDQNPFSIRVSDIGQQGAGFGYFTPLLGCCFWTDTPPDPE